MSDLIDRYEVIELLKKMRYEADSKWEREMITETENKINAMPSAEPILQIKYAAISQLKELGYGLGEKPKKGKWIPHKNGDENIEWIEYSCSECGSEAYPVILKTNYCPICGADMRGEENETD